MIEGVAFVGQDCAKLGQSWRCGRIEGASFSRVVLGAIKTVSPAACPQGLIHLIGSSVRRPSAPPRAPDLNLGRLGSILCIGSPLLTRPVSSPGPCGATSTMSRVGGILAKGLGIHPERWSPPENTDPDTYNEVEPTAKEFILEHRPTVAGFKRYIRSLFPFWSWIFRT